MTQSGTLTRAPKSFGLLADHQGRAEMKPSRRLWSRLAVLPGSRYLPNMSTGAIKQVVDELQDLPESDQNLVLGFLQALKRQRGAPPARAPRRGRNPALKEIDGALVFTGEIGDPNTDWVQVDRSEREQEIIRVAVGPIEHR